jgi:MFS family permease
VGSVLVFILWRAAGLISFQTTRPDKMEVHDRGDVSYKLMLSERPFILYLIPWAMFSLVNFFHQPLQQFYWGAERSTMITVLEFGIGSVAALIGGHISDKVGRKRLIILGYVILGIGYAILSILPTNDISIGTYVILDGVAWGLFALIFFIVIWGDLAGTRRKDRYYLLGELPFLISSYLSAIVDPYVSVIPMSASFSLSSFFLFLAVLPLMYAPETLPEKRIKDMELRSYLEKAKKVKERFT